MSSTEAPATQVIKEVLPKQGNSFMEIDGIFDGMSNLESYKRMDEIYEDYAKAMRMRQREPLSEDRFQSHFFNNLNKGKSIAFGSEKDGYLLGNEVDDVFVPTHFAPTGLRQGYRLIKDAMQADRPTALFITDDLAETVSKMDGWKRLPMFKIKANFRNSVTEKTLVVNKWEAIPKLVLGTAKTVVRDRLSGIEQRFRHLGERAKQLVSRDNANADDLDEEVQAVIKETVEEQTNHADDLAQTIRREAILDFDDDD